MVLKHYLLCLTIFCSIPALAGESCEPNLSSDNGVIRIAPSWSRISLKAVKLAPYLIVKRDEPAVITRDGQDIVLSISLRDLPRFLQRMSASPDPGVVKWANRVQGRFEDWQINTERAKGLAKVWNNAKVIEEVAENTFFEMFDERLYDRFTQAGRRFALISLDAQLGLRTTLPTLSPTHQKVSAVKPIKTAAVQPVVTNSVGLLFQRFSKEGRLTVVEDASFSRLVTTKFRGVHLTRFLDALIDKDPLELSAPQDPKTRELTFVPISLTFPRYLSGLKAYSLTLYRYRDQKDVDHIVIESLHEFSHEELLDHTANESLNKPSYLPITPGGVLLPKNLNQYPFVESTLGMIGEILEYWSLRQPSAVKSLKVNETRDFVISVPTGRFSDSYLSNMRKTEALSFKFRVRRSDRGPVLLAMLPLKEGLTQNLKVESEEE